MDLPPRRCFVLAAIGTAGRDLFYFYWLRDELHPISYGAITVSAVSACALLSHRALGNHPTSFCLELRDLGRVQWIKIAVLGLLCAYIYTYFWVTVLLTPGLFNLLDFGVTPLLTMLIAGAAFAEAIHWIRYAVLLLYGVGLFLFHEAGFADSSVILVAVTYPLATVLSDAIAKTLVSGSRPVTPDLLLFMRFGLATPVLLGVASPLLWSERSDTLTIAVASAVALGYVPMKLLMLGLRQGRFRDLALADMLIPVIAFAGSIPVLMHEPRWESWLGLVIITAAFVLQLDLHPEAKEEVKHG